MEVTQCDCLTHHIDQPSPDILQNFPTNSMLTAPPVLACFPAGSDGKESARNAEDPGLIPGSGRSSGEWNGNPLQYSCLENSMDKGA